MGAVTLTPLKNGILLSFSKFKMQPWGLGKKKKETVKDSYITRICASLGSRMKFKTLCYPVFGRNKSTALPSF